MTSPHSAEMFLHQAWVSLGIPLVNIKVWDERKTGIVDPEVLLVLTFLLLPKVRFAVDIVAWLQLHDDLINHQKLKNMLAIFPRHFFQPLEQDVWLANNKLRKWLDIKQKPRTDLINAVKQRMVKLEPREKIASQNTMLAKRLLYGTGFRSDIIAILEQKFLSGSILARLLCTKKSTVSRILADLRMVEFIDAKNKLIHPVKSPLKIFMSADTLTNYLHRLQAQKFSRQLLKQQELDQINLEFDGLNAL